jgi:hypothetical protein
LEGEQRDFVKFKEQCVNAANTNAYLINVPGPPPNAAELLKAGAKRIAQLQKNLDTLDREIAELPDQKARRAYENEQHRQAQARRQQALDIQSVNY